MQGESFIDDLNPESLVRRVSQSGLVRPRRGPFSVRAHGFFFVDQ